MNKINKQNKKLKETIKKLRSVISAQKELIIKYRDNWMLNLFNSLNAITDEYSCMLNPLPVEVKASYQNRSELFKIRLADIIGVFSEGRTKIILLKEKISNIGSDERTTNIIYIGKNFKSVINDLDKSNFQLCKVDKSTFINVKYYDLNTDSIICKKELGILNVEYKKLTLNSKYKADFIQKKQTFNRIYSLQKLFVDYKLKNGLPI